MSHASDALSVVAALGLPIGAAWFLHGAFLPDARPSAASRATRAVAAALLGLGLSSLLPFAWLLCGGTIGRAYARADAAALVAVASAAAWAARRRAGRGSAVAGGDSPREGRADAIAAALVVTALAVFVVAFYRAAAAGPHGGWDAWSIWNLRARFIFRGGAAWRDAYAPELAWSQPGYPLLLPLAVARAWAYSGESTIAPGAIAAIFALSVPVAVGAAVARQAGAVPGAVAALLLLATPMLTRLAAAQYADVAVAAFLVAALSALGRGGCAEGSARSRELAVAGLFLGLGGWTKNEGLAAAACAVVAHLALARGPVARRVADLAPLALGATLPAAAWALFHGVIEPGIAPALATASGGPGMFDRLAAPGRAGTILAAFWGRLPGREHHVAAVALVLAVALGARPGRLARSVPLAAATLLVAADVLVYLATPLDLPWHLGTSAERVLFQPWPAVLLGLFSAVDPPIAEVAGGTGPLAHAGQPAEPGGAVPG